MLKQSIQKFGRFLSGMIMPNIGAFIAWGLITALFIPTGWVPNEHLAKLVGPMISYLLPLLIGYTGGSIVGGQRGGVVGAVATIGVVVGADIPMFLGAMIVGPLGGWCIQKTDAFLQPRTPAGFEMLVNNFSAGIVAMILALLAFLLIGHSVEALTGVLTLGVGILVDHNLLPLVSIFVEPGKILFMNNAINHGIFTPLGIEQSKEMGRSLFFLIEANPGTGLGLLLAYYFFGTGEARQSSVGAMIIHFLGGIHEIYFPYVLMRPALILAMIVGGIVNVSTLLIFNGGLVAPASPGSIFAVLLMTPKGAYFGVLSAVILGGVASFIVSSLILKWSPLPEGPAGDLAEAQRKTAAMKATAKGQSALGQKQGLSDIVPQNVRKIYTACDAGMGSSAVGATLLRKKVHAAGLSCEVGNSAINNLPADADIVITHESLTPLAQKVAPQAVHLSLSYFTDGVFYDALVKRLQEK